MRGEGKGERRGRRVRGKEKGEENMLLMKKKSITFLTLWEWMIAVCFSVLIMITNTANELDKIFSP